VRALIQRVSEASVTVAGERIAAVGGGLLVLVAAGAGDGPDAPAELAAKVARLRVFADAEGRMNRSITDVGGEALVVSQFTLYMPTCGGATGPGSPARRRLTSASGWSTRSRPPSGNWASPSRPGGSARTCRSRS
jgi:D-tyrosyl-tRNA(Tyr) deacylase